MLTDVHARVPARRRKLVDGPAPGRAEVRRAQPLAAEYARRARGAPRPVGARARRALNGALCRVGPQARKAAIEEAQALFPKHPAASVPASVGEVRTRGRRHAVPPGKPARVDG